MLASVYTTPLVIWLRMGWVAVWRVINSLWSWIQRIFKLYPKRLILGPAGTVWYPLAMRLSSKAYSRVAKLIYRLRLSCSGVSESTSVIWYYSSDRSLFNERSLDWSKSWYRGRCSGYCRCSRCGINYIAQATQRNLKEGKEDIWFWLRRVIGETKWTWGRTERIYTPDDTNTVSWPGWNGWISWRKNPDS